MSHDDSNLPSEAAGGNGHLIVKPQTSVGVAAEQQRVQAEIQSRLMVAKTCRRDEVDALDRIKNACQRPGLAAVSEYAYSRGGTEIVGPSIDLLTVIANCWGNIDYGFRELSQANKESTVECFAWDLETNAKRTITVTVPHKRYTRSGSYDLTDQRDIYETVSNYAQRRVRKCLEDIVPPDVVEDAVIQCRETLKANADVTPEGIKKLTDAFGKIGVTTEQITKRIGRRLDSMQPAQLVSLRRIFKSIQDGMSQPTDWFESAEGDDATPQSAADATKDALRKKSKPSPKEDAPADEPADTELVAQVRAELPGIEAASDVEGLRASFRKKAKTDAEREAIDELCKARTVEIREAKEAVGA